MPPAESVVFTTQCSFVSTHTLLVSPLVDTPLYFTVLRPFTSSLPSFVQLPQLEAALACAATFFHCGQASFTSGTRQNWVINGAAIASGASMYMCRSVKSTMGMR